MNYLGSVEEEGLDIMRPLGIFLENCRSLRAWKIWAIWIKRVKLGIGRDEAAGAAGQLGLARGAVGSTERHSEPLAEGSALPFPSLALQTIGIVLLLLLLAVHLPARPLCTERPRAWRQRWGSAWHSAGHRWSLNGSGVN